MRLNLESVAQISLQLNIIKQIVPAPDPACAHLAGRTPRYRQPGAFRGVKRAGSQVLANSAFEHFGYGVEQVFWGEGFLECFAGAQVTGCHEKLGQAKLATA